MDDTAADLPQRRFRRWAGYLFAAAGLVWVLHDVGPGQLMARLTIRDWRWAAAAIVADMLAYLAQGWRWSLLLSPLGRIEPLRATQAIYVGLFTNEVMPLRAGEFARTWLVSRWLKTRFTAVLHTIAVERLLDGIWLAVGIGMAAVFFPLPHSIETAADILGTAVFGCVVVFGYLVYSRKGRFHEIASSGKILPAALISLLMIFLQALAFWMVMPAFGLSFPWWLGIVVFFIVHAGTAIPNAPGNIGSYQFFVVLGLTLFGVDKPTATAFSFVVFLVLSLPLLALGFLAYLRASDPPPSALLSPLPEEESRRGREGVSPTTS